MCMYVCVLVCVCECVRAFVFLAAWHHIILYTYTLEISQ